MRILGIIPARAGSKGIPGKNLKLLGGRPLLDYTIEAATEATLLTDVLFSSDSEEMIGFARSKSILCPFVRPSHLASDEAKSIDVVKHAIHFMGKENYDAVCLLQVTSPFRQKGELDAAISMFEKTNADSLISMKKVPDHFNPHWTFEQRNEEDPYLKIATGEKSIIPRRQELPDAYYRDGSIYITNIDVLQNMNGFIGQKLVHFESKGPGINLDSMDDWTQAEEYLKKQS